MSSSNRATVLTKLHKVLKKHYKPVEPGQRTVLEHLLYAAVLENADFETADECFAKLQENYFDWNEVRVTTITELAETINTVRDAAAAAHRVKKSLQAVFEAHYQFDIEPLKKQNLGKSITDLEKHEGISPFGIAYVTQNALGGHSIALGRGALEVLLAVSAATDPEVAKHQVAGIERAIPKNKGTEFFSLLHQLGVDLMSSPQSTRVKSILAEVDSQAKERLSQYHARLAEQAAAAHQAKVDAKAARVAAAKAASQKPPPGKQSKAAEAEAKKKAEAEKAKQNKSKPAAAAPAPSSAKATPPPKAAAKPAAEEKSKDKKAGGSKGLTKRKPK